MSKKKLILCIVSAVGTIISISTTISAYPKKEKGTTSFHEIMVLRTSRAATVAL